MKDPRATSLSGVPEPSRRWYGEDVPDIAETLGTDPERGIADAEVTKKSSKS